jgi:hypothetical protein
MSVWVNVWGGPLARRGKGKMGLAALLCALALSGCIDDFDNPKGYGRSPDGRSPDGGGPDGHDCAALCTEYEQCDGSTSASECRSQCDDTDRIVRAAGCEQVYDDLIACYAREDDFCSASESCADEVDDFVSCISYYCLSNVDGCSL